MDTKKLTALDIYINSVYKITLLSITIACLMAGMSYTAYKLDGFFSSVSIMAFLIFDLTNLIYLGIAIFFIKTGFENGCVKPSKLRQSKIFLLIILFIQFNFILYMAPTRVLWAYAFLFIIVTGLLVDTKMIKITILEIVGSLAVAFGVNGKALLPIRDEMFFPNFSGMIGCLALTMTFIYLNTYLVSRFLVKAKKEEMERNDERVNNVLSSVKVLSENLHSVSGSLSQIAEAESASAKELSTSSEQLLGNSNLLATKTDESMSNLEELNQWVTVVNDNVEKVETASRDLLEKAEYNGRLLNDLQMSNNEVSDSMVTTIGVADKLSKAVEEIEVAVNLINDISSSINLLALNASIEAARAGEAGRGFAVVAEEVGNLANSTSASVKEVESVIARVQSNVKEIALHIEENSRKLEKQNGYFNNVFQGMQNMTDSLNISVESVNTMGEVHHKQADVIKSTVLINKAIAESIGMENQQFVSIFGSINDMVERNVNDITEMLEQVNVINEMVSNINDLMRMEE